MCDADNYCFYSGMEFSGELYYPVKGAFTQTASAELYHTLLPSSPPALFSLTGGGRGQGAIWHFATGQVATDSNPAAAGEALSMFTNGLAPGCVIPPQVPIGVRLAESLYFDDAPNGYPGCYQVNFRVPVGDAPGID